MRDRSSWLAPALAAGRGVGASGFSAIGSASFGGSGSTKTVLQYCFSVSSCSSLSRVNPWKMNGVSVQGRSSSTTYMPIFSSATGTLFFICVRLPHARAASGCERARGAEGALRVHLSPHPAGGRGDRGAEPAAERLPVAVGPDRADRVLADRDPAHRGGILGAGAGLPAQRRRARGSAAVDPAGGVRRGGARRRLGFRDGRVLP